MHLHSEEFMTFLLGGYGLMTLSYAVRTFPKPQNVYGLWALGIIQYLLLNMEQGKDNFKQISDKKVIQQAQDTRENMIAEQLKPIIEASKKDV